MDYQRFAGSTAPTAGAGGTAPRWIMGCMASSFVHYALLTLAVGALGLLVVGFVFLRMVWHWITGRATPGSGDDAIDGDYADGDGGGDAGDGGD